MDAVSGSDCKILVTEINISSGKIVRMEGENKWTFLLDLASRCFKQSAQGQTIYLISEPDLVPH